jgi:hypothetical protein
MWNEAPPNNVVITVDGEGELLEDVVVAEIEVSR